MGAGGVFRALPPLEILLTLCKQLAHTEHPPYVIQAHQLEKYVWGNEILELLPYYIPSMAKRFFDEEDRPIHGITILRHIAKAHNWVCITAEVTRDKKKQKIYTLQPYLDSRLLGNEVIIEFN